MAVRRRRRTTAPTSGAATTTGPAGGAATAAVGGDPNRLIPPEGGAVIRMYRLGHGDCFLIAFAGADPQKPSYVWIDCGYKPGSPGKVVRTPARDVGDVAKDLQAATGGYVDVAVVTHEHQDHVNGLSSSRFKNLKIGRVWFAWTENPKDKVANALRKKFKDQLLGLLGARNRLAAAGNKDESDALDRFLFFELGGEDTKFDPAAAARMLGADGSGSMNKKAMKFLESLAEEKTEYLKPH